ncbi:MAG: PEP/pyruvate-binding domain-containing protein [Desulfovermiculus sp.]
MGQRIIPLVDVRDENTSLVGGKAVSLARLHHSGVNVPAGLCITTQAYTTYVQQTGVRERMHMELERKPLEDMRWEEMWDAALRIRSMFLNTPMPHELEQDLSAGLKSFFASGKAVVRSSAPGEDSGGTSFAGLHESYVNVGSLPDLLESVRKVWASLFSDAALLYRRELGLNVATSSMAVVVQHLIHGQVSGVAFTRSPEDERVLVIEAVHGLNKGLVDGIVEPDRWTLDRRTGKVLTSYAPVRDRWIVPTSQGTQQRALDENTQNLPPLDKKQLMEVYTAALQAEELFGSAQDMEWTMDKGHLHVLQTRPITTGRNTNREDHRGWYLSLRRSLDNLKALRIRIEQEILPGMDELAAVLGEQDLRELSDPDLAGEMLRRKKLYAQWERVYWDECIPYAHGARLFGQVYNDTLKPSDPFEFVQLLSSSGMLSLERNQMLHRMAAVVQKNPDLRKALSDGRPDEADAEFGQLLTEFLDRFGDLFCHQASCTQGREDVLGLVLKMAKHGRLPDQSIRDADDALEKSFLQSLGPEGGAQAQELLDLARSSYRLRDDDNIYLGRIEAELNRTVTEAQARLAGQGIQCAGHDPQVLAAALQDPKADNVCQAAPKAREDTDHIRVRSRQIQGQPAGPGVVQGTARVVHSVDDLRHFEAGEILVCDAVDPNMTAIVVLASGIVERRGGMLIHGAIIAREYGLPCVTGVPRALQAIHSGDVITVDGYLGIVTIVHSSAQPEAALNVNP